MFISDTFIESLVILILVRLYKLLIIITTRLISVLLFPITTIVWVSYPYLKWDNPLKTGTFLLNVRSLHRTRTGAVTTKKGPDSPIAAYAFKAYVFFNGDSNRICNLVHLSDASYYLFLWLIFLFPPLGSVICRSIPDLIQRASMLLASGTPTHTHIYNRRSYHVPLPSELHPVHLYLEES